MKKSYEIGGKPMQLREVDTIFQIPAECPGVILVVPGIVETSDIIRLRLEGLVIKDTRCPIIAKLDNPQLDSGCIVHPGFCPASTPIDTVVYNRRINR